MKLASLEVKLKELCHIAISSLSTKDLSLSDKDMLNKTLKFLIKEFGDGNIV